MAAEHARHFATAMAGVEVSMALLQGFFLKHRDDGPMGALQATHLLREEAEAIAHLQQLMGTNRHDQDPSDGHGHHHQESRPQR